MAKRGWNQDERIDAERASDSSRPKVVAGRARFRGQ